jgi:L-iditol 2-dehydrogenase
MRSCTLVTMTVAELYEPKRFRLIEQPISDPRPGEIQVRVLSIGICGSDVHYFSEGGIGDTPCIYPMVLGHEPVGEIVRTGPGVTGWSAGDRAALEPAIYCYHCEFCMTGRHNVCSNIRFLSTPGDPGFFRTFVNLPTTNVLPLPKEIGTDEATLFEPLAVALHSMKFAALAPGENAVVFGAGPIGLLTIAVFKLCGATRIWAVEPRAHRRAMALAAGADVVIDPRQVDPGKQVLADTCQRGADVSIDCATKDDTMNDAIHATRNAGRVVITGIPSEARVALDFHVLRRKELVFYNVRRSAHESDVAIRMLAGHPQIFGPLVTHARPLDEVQAAFRMLEAYEDGVGKVVLRPRP